MTVVLLLFHSILNMCYMLHPKYLKRANKQTKQLLDVVLSSSSYNNIIIIIIKKNCMHRQYTHIFLIIVP